jgi:single-strand DNA-binding protein
LNHVQLIGHLGKDPEVRTTQDGKKVANLSIATSESWKDKSTGEKRERTEWHRVVIFNDGLSGVAEQYLRKGSKVYMSGQIQTRKWTDQNNQERFTTEVVPQAFGGQLILLGDPKGGGEASQCGTASRSAQQPRKQASADDDEIPF